MKIKALIISILLSISVCHAQSGKEIYNSVCSACHGPNAEGMAGMFPPIEKSSFLKENPQDAILFPKFGHSGEITVNGQSYNNVMPPIGAKLSDKDLMNVYNYVNNNFGNSNGTISLKEVDKIIKK